MMLRASTLLSVLACASALQARLCMRALSRARVASPPRLALPADVFLGIDCGTQSTKVLLYDAGARTTIGVGSVNTPVNPTDVVGRAEQDPSAWVDAMVGAAKQALAAAGKASGVSADAIASAVRGIGVSGQQHGLVALDAEYNVLRPSKLWCDTESSKEADELAEQLGWGIVASFTSTKLLWMKRNEPDVFARLAHVALRHDYLNYVLTGNLVMECGDASGTGLLDTTGRGWDAEAAAMIDESLAGKLPPLLAPTDRAGELTASAASMLGLPVGVPVSVGGGDNMMSALGCGCSVEGRIAISLGTSGTLFAKTARAAMDPSGAICPFLDATGGGLPLMCTLNCASVPEEFRSGYGLGREEIAELAAAEPIGCEGLTVLPYLAGERTPNWPHASGVLAGIRAGHLARPGLVYRAALEGVTFSLKGGVAAIKEACGMSDDFKEVRLVGGGSKSELWQRIIADATQMRVACPDAPESAALGAALQAAAMVAGADEIGEWIAQNHEPPVSTIVEPDPEVRAKRASNKPSEPRPLGGQDA